MIFYAGVNFFLAALNVYYGINGTGNTALNWAAAVFIFGFGLIQIAFYIHSLFFSKTLLVWKSWLMNSGTVSEVTSPFTAH